MSAEEQLQQIPIQQEHVPGAQSVHRWRRISQWLVVTALVLIPITGLFRIDMMAGAFHMLDYQVSFSDIAIVMGFWMMMATGLIFLYSWAGSVFCGWICPQNTISEWANALTAKLLGRRALVMDVTGMQMQVARRKDKLLNKAVLFGSFLLISMLFAMVPLLYFFEPHVIWSFISMHPVPLAENLLWIYLVCVVIILIDVAAMRHLVCKYMCIYRVWQHSFKTQDTLHIAYDETRSDDCAHCNYCVDSCFLDIDPRQAQVFDSCINCGDCVAACDDLHSKSKKMTGAGLLSFKFGSGDKKTNGLGSLLGRGRAAMAGTLLGVFIFVVGIMNYQPYTLVVDRAELLANTTSYDYRINVTHKRYQPAVVHFKIIGLNANDYVLDEQNTAFKSAGRKDVLLHFSPKIKKGLHRITVQASSDDGWQASFPLVYFAEGVKK
ncbi:MAG: 4Fe-4S binding protein [Mariprofundaceae bacterium]|nr:4Fe-4S binding protein [Mariprofundaceae bacterium]